MTHDKKLDERRRPRRTEAERMRALRNLGPGVYSLREWPFVNPDIPAWCPPNGRRRNR
jgi:hypothetical protein